MAHRAEIVDLRFDLYGCKPKYLAIGGQQSLWVTCTATAEVVGLMRDKSIERYPVDGTPEQIALGGESIWFTMPRIDAAGSIDHDGKTHNFAMPKGSEPMGIATVGDDTWVTLRQQAELARIGADGRVGIVPPGIDYDSEGFDPDKAGAEFIVVDRMGAAWISIEALGAIVSVSVAAEPVQARVWTTPDEISPHGIAVDNSAVWVADHGDGGMWRLDRASGAFQRVEAWPKGIPSCVTSDLLGGVWFSEPDEDLVGHLDADGQLTEYDISDYGMTPQGMAVDRDGVAWVALVSGGVIGVQPPSVM